MTLQHTESFVPLTTLPAAPEHQEFRLTIVPATGQIRPLQSAVPSSPVPLGSGAGTICEPCVSLQYDGDRVTHIRIQCSCGQIMDLACVYEPAAKPA
jgi:hypothetical protein